MDFITLSVKSVKSVSNKSAALLALAAFWLPVMGPLTQAGKMTCSHDGALYLLRVFQLDAMLARGVVWPRWSPGMAFGYGYPLFNFHPALALYPAVGLHRLGLSLLQAWNWSLGLSLLASGLAAYLWARRSLGQGGAFVVGVAYMLAPYSLYDVYWRGNLPESLSLPLLPLALWAAMEVAQRRRWRYVAPAALAYAAILLTHPAVGLMFTPVLLSYMAMLWLGEDEKMLPSRKLPSFLEGRSRAMAVQLAAVCGLGLGLAAFFLAPAFLEKSYVQIERGITPAGQNFHNHFLSLGEVLGPGQASDPLLVNPSPPRSLGLTGGLLALAGLALTVLWRTRFDRPRKLQVAWAGLSLLVIIVMTLPVSQPAWEHIPLLPFIQFPWRWLGVGSLLMAWLVGAGLDALISATQGLRRAGAAIAAGGALLLALGAYPWAYPHLCSAAGEQTQASYTAYEKAVGMIGTTSSGEYLPVYVEEFPTTSPFVDDLLAGRPVSRWQSEGVQVLEARDDGLQAGLLFEAEAPAQILYQAFYFPGWQARLDGQPAPIRIVAPLGLMAVDAPAGRHSLTLRFESTPLRRAAGAVSLLVWHVLLGLWLLARAAGREGGDSSPAAPRLSHWAWLSLIGLGLAVWGLKLGVVDRYDTPLRWRRLKDGVFSGAAQASQAVVAEQAHLLGYTLYSQATPAGELLMADLFWSVSAPLKFRVTLRLLDERGLMWSYKDEIDTALIGYSNPPPSHQWPLGAYARQRHAIRVLPGAPPGQYLLVALPFKPNSLDPLPVTAGQPAPGGYPGMVVGPVTVSRPAHPPQADALDLAVQTDLALGDLRLVGYSQDRAEAAPGDGLLLALGWQAQRAPQADYHLRLDLLDAGGRSIARFGQPLAEQYPSSRWQPGEVVLCQAAVAIPGRADSGRYTWQASLLDAGETLVGQAALGDVEIVAPPRAFAPPAVAQRLETRLGDWVALLGFDAPAQASAGQPLAIQLVWQAITETDQAYKSFVHLLDSQGQLVAQSDAVPAGWTRPTPGWQSGEYVIDLHTLGLKRDLPAGEYTLKAGMYDDNGRRLLTAAGDDTISLGVIQVIAPQ